MGDSRLNHLGSLLESKNSTLRREAANALGKYCLSDNKVVETGFLSDAEVLPTNNSNSPKRDDGEYLTIDCNIIKKELKIKEDDVHPCDTSQSALIAFVCRHGTAIALSRVLAGSYTSLPSVLVDNCALRLLQILVLDQFNDFVSGRNATAPVRETCAQALGHLLHKTNESRRIIILNHLRILIGMKGEKLWHCRQSALLVLKYFFAVASSSSIFDECNICKVCILLNWNYDFFYNFTFFKRYSFYKIWLQLRSGLDALAIDLMSIVDTWREIMEGDWLARSFGLWTGCLLFDHRNPVIGKVTVLCFCILYYLLSIYLYMNNCIYIYINIKKFNRSDPFERMGSEEMRFLSDRSLAVQLLFVPYLRSDSLYQNLGASIILNEWAALFKAAANRSSPSQQKCILSLIRHEQQIKPTPQSRNAELMLLVGRIFTYLINKDISILNFLVYLLILIIFTCEINVRLLCILFRLSYLDVQLSGAVALFAPLVFARLTDKEEEIRDAAGEAFRNFVPLLALENIIIINQFYLFIWYCLGYEYFTFWSL
uniref:HEAT repeat-containing protein 6 n=1 Tax=Heterorhabditis bacteriophora TaxID=37862 RepID=A0A1I7WFG9_HETBA